MPVEEMDLHIDDSIPTCGSCGENLYRTGGSFDYCTDCWQLLTAEEKALFPRAKVLDVLANIGIMTFFILIISLFVMVIDSFKTGSVVAFICSSILMGTFIILAGAADSKKHKAIIEALYYVDHAFPGLKERRSRAMASSAPLPVINTKNLPDDCPYCGRSLHEKGGKKSRRCRGCGHAWCLNCGTWNKHYPLRCVECGFMLPSD